MHDQKLSSSPMAPRHTWRPISSTDQITQSNHDPGDDATGLLDWILIWEQAPWRGM